MRRARLKKLQLPVAPLRLQPLRRHGSNGVLGLDGHAVEKHPVAAHPAGGTEPRGGLGVGKFFHKILFNMGLCRNLSIQKPFTF